MARNPKVQLNQKTSGSNDVFKRILFLIGALLVFRLGSYIPVPGVNATVLSSVLHSQNDTVLQMFNMFSGGALSRASIFALGIMPYISASIIIQLLTSVVPSLEALKKEGESGNHTITKYTRYAALGLAIVQSIGISVGLPKIIPNLVPHLDFSFYIVASISLVTGSMFLMWLGEQITERGIGNGVSMIIFVGILSSIPSAMAQTIAQVSEGEISIFVLFIILAVVLAVTFCVVYVEMAQRKIEIHHARQQRGTFAPTQKTYLPLKINMAGVIPPIFASSIILLPATLAQWLGKGANAGWLYNLSRLLRPGAPLYLILFAVAIIFFAFFYTGMQYNPRDTADNLKRSGAYIPGIRPGEQTSRFIDKIMTHLTMIAGIYLTLVCLVPYVMTSTWSLSFTFGGTSLLIVVVVIMDFMAQLQSRMMSSDKYESALEKANLRKFKK
ncbi:MAG: preprotein translocase subunit SecY [Psittacicella sp.]